MEKILVTGSSGMLGQTLLKVLGERFDIFGLGSAVKTEHNYISADIRDKSNLIKEISKVKPKIIIHSAAISDVEYCEANPKEAEEVNASGTSNIASIAGENGSFLIYISTDYVFEGSSREPYRESDITGPINTYASTKLKGEEYLKESLRDCLIIRTSWLFGPGRDNFATNIIKKAKEDKELKIVADKFGSPTYTLDLASAISDIISLWIAEPNSFNKESLLHISNSGSCSRYEFTDKVLQYAGIKDIKVSPIESESFNWKAKRPTYSVLDNGLFESIMGYKLRPWQDALKEYLESFKEEIINKV